MPSCWSWNNIEWWKLEITFELVPASKTSLLNLLDTFFFYPTTYAINLKQVVMENFLAKPLLFCFQLEWNYSSKNYADRFGTGLVCVCVCICVCVHMHIEGSNSDMGCTQGCFYKACYMGSCKIEGLGNLVHCWFTNSHVAAYNLSDLYTGYWMHHYSTPGICEMLWVLFGC